MNVVAVAPCHVPLVIGGDSKLWWGLVGHLNRATSHHADIIKLPGPERDFWEVVDSYRTFSELDLTDYEVIVSGKYPAWMSDHPCHILYMQHPLRGLYDTYPADFPRRYETTHADVNALLEVVRSGDYSRSALRETFSRLESLRNRGRRRVPWKRVPSGAYAFPGPLIRELVHFFDRVAFRPGAIRRFCAISETVAARDGYLPPEADVRAVHHPTDLTGFRPPRAGRHLFTVSRLDRPKRIDLLIEAMRHVRMPTALVIAGIGPDEARLRKLAGDDPRVRFAGFVNDSELLDLYAEAQAVLFVPYDEDLGLVTVEAMSAQKPVITTRDAGGVRELVTDGVTGLIAEPQPQSIAEQIERLLTDPQLAETMGAAGKERVRDVNWQRVVDTLLAGIDP